MSNLIIGMLSSIALFAGYKWFKWKFTALTVIAFCEDKYREPTAEEVNLYGEFVLKSMLHIKSSKM